MKKNLFAVLEDAQRMLIGKAASIDNFDKFSSAGGITLYPNGISVETAEKIVSTVKDFKGRGWRKFEKDKTKYILSSKILHSKVCPGLANWICLEVTNTQYARMLLPSAFLKELKGYTDDDNQGKSVYELLKDQLLNPISLWAVVFVSIILGAVVGWVFTLFDQRFIGPFLISTPIIALLWAWYDFSLCKEKFVDAANRKKNMENKWPKSAWYNLFFPGMNAEEDNHLDKFYFRVEFGSFFMSDEFRENLNRLLRLSISQDVNGTIVYFIQKDSIGEHLHDFDPVERKIVIHGGITAAIRLPNGSFLFDRDSILTRNIEIDEAEQAKIAENVAQLGVRVFI